MPTDPFQSQLDSPSAPAQMCFDITPDDSSSLTVVTKALYVGEAGDLVVVSQRNSTPVTFRNVPSGFILDIRAKAVHATGTSASNIIGLA